MPEQVPNTVEESIAPEETKTEQLIVATYSNKQQVVSEAAGEAMTKAKPV